MENKMRELTNEQWDKLHAEAEKFYAENERDMNGLDEIQKATNFAIHALAAVSASPQPRCPKCGHDIFNVQMSTAFCQWAGCGYEGRVTEFFAPAPAQESPIVRCHTCKSTLIYKREDGEIVIYHTCNPKPAQPVENSSRCAKCVICGEVEANYRHDEATASPQYYHKFEPISGGASTETLQEVMERVSEFESEGGASTGEQPRCTCNGDIRGIHHRTAQEPCTAEGCPCELNASRPSGPSAPKVDPDRCAVCGWPLAESAEKGCVAGNCSMRPFPDIAYDPIRANREYGKEIFKSQQATETASAPRLTPGEWLRSQAKPTLTEGQVSLGPLTEKRLCELLEGYAVYSAAAPSVAGTQPTPAGIPGDILEHEYRHEHGLLNPGECQMSHCVGTFWTEQEIAVIDKLSKKQDLSHVAVLRGALRNYQLLVEGVPQLPDKVKECEFCYGILPNHKSNCRTGAAQGTPQVEDAVDAIMRLGYTHDRAWQRDAVSKALRPFFPKHLPGAPAQPGPEEK